MGTTPLSRRLKGEPSRDASRPKMVLFRPHSFPEAGKADKPKKCAEKDLNINSASPAARNLNKLEFSAGFAVNRFTGVLPVNGLPVLWILPRRQSRQSTMTK